MIESINCGCFEIMCKLLEYNAIGDACINTNYNFIGIELNKEYFDIAKKRIEDSKNNE